MTQPDTLKVIVRLTFWDIWRSLLVVLAYSKRPWRWLISVLKNFLMLAVMFFAFCYALCGFRESLPLMALRSLTFALLFFFAFIPIFMLLFPPLLLIFMIVTKQAPSLRKPVAYEFSVAGVNVQNQNSSVQVPWANLIAVRETKRWFLLYRRRNIAFILPKGSFATTAEMEALRELARANFPGAIIARPGT